MAEYFICKKCGKTLHEESFGEVYDNDSGGYIQFCPYCGNHEHFIEAERCECCGEVHNLSEMVGKLCEGCFGEASHNKSARVEYFEKLDDGNQMDVVYQDAVGFSDFLTQKSGRRYI